jgi:hypothetical protein
MSASSRLLSWAFPLLGVAPLVAQPQPVVVEAVRLVDSVVLPARSLRAESCATRQRGVVSSPLILRQGADGRPK